VWSSPGRTLVGRVVDDEGHPVSGARVSRWRTVETGIFAMSPPQLFVLEDEVLTDQAGGFCVERFDELGDSLMAWALDHEATPVWYLEATGVITLQRRTPIDGVVVSRDTGQPIAGAEVTLGPPPPRTAASWPTDLPFQVSVRTSDDGGFRLPPPWQQDLRLWVTVGGIRVAMWTPSQAARVRYRLRVRTIPPFHGRVIDSGSGRPVATFAVGTVSARDRPHVPPDKRIPFGPSTDGSFALHGFASWPRRVIVYATGYATAVREIRVNRPDPSDPVIFALDAGTTVRGRVLRWDARPVVGALVWIEPDPAEPPSVLCTQTPQEWRPPFPHTRTDAEGVFSIRNVREGRSVVAVRALGERPWNSPVFLVGEPTPATHPDIRLPRGGSLTVMCPDRSGYIVLSGVSPNDRAVVPIRGPSVEFHGLTTGSYRVKVWNGGCLYESGPTCEVAEGRSVEISFPKRR
jgi:hypothetical protein